MPNWWDNTYHYEYSKATFDTIEDKVRHQKIREADYLLEPAIPELPDRQTELDYMRWLEEDMRCDPWLSWRKQKYMASPKRYPFGNRVDLVNKFRQNFIANWLFGAMVFSPAAILIGRRFQKYQGGVNVVPYMRFVHDWPNVHPIATTTKKFRQFAFGSAGFVGFCFACSYTDYTTMSNKHYTRPDLKPFPAMVKDKSHCYDEVAYEQMMDHCHPRTDKKTGYLKWLGQRDEVEKTSWYRFFFPLDADFNLKQNLFVDNGRDPSLNFYPGTGGGFPHTNNYKEHEND